LFDNGILNSRNVRIVETTPPYSDYVWAVSDSLGEGVRLALIDAFLDLDASDSEHRKILRAQGANAYLPASSDDFEIVRLAAKQARLFPESREN
jgi:phosphonate transport system substrate-binding protein